MTNTRSIGSSAARRVVLVASLALLASVGMPGGQAYADPPPDQLRDNGTHALCSDPSMLVPGNGRRYMFCTNLKVYVAPEKATYWPSRSVSALHHGGVLPVAACGGDWAPSVMKRSRSTKPYKRPYVMIFEAHRRNKTTNVCDTSKRCLYVMTAKHATGPYKALFKTTSTVACGVNTYAAEWFRANGATWIVAHRNGLGRARALSFHKMAANGLKLDKHNQRWHATGVTVTEPWEHQVKHKGKPAPPLEGPDFVRSPEGYWVLFYSAANWHTNRYSMGYAICGTRKIPSDCHKPGGPNHNRLHLEDADQVLKGVGAGMVYRSSDGTYRLIAAGHYCERRTAPTCTHVPTQDRRRRYAMLYDLDGLRATPPNDLHAKPVK